MKKKIIISVLVIVVLFVENWFLYEVSQFNFELKELDNVRESQKGLADACSKLQIGDDLLATLKTLQKYGPLLRTDNDKTIVYFKLDSIDSIGLSLVFNADDKLIKNDCKTLNSK